jgi:ComF family protein
MTPLPFFQRLLESLEPIYDLFYPPRCVSCQADTAYFCANCKAELSYIKPPVCNKCGYPIAKQNSFCHQCQTNPLNYLNAIRSAAFFDYGALKTAIHQFKYQGITILYRDFAPMLADCYSDHQLNSDVIVPVPLHKSRYKERGYNQAALLAQGLSKLIGLPVNRKALVRHRITKTQMTLKAEERKINVSNAFVCQSTALKGKKILLIDDVCTTGATLDACAQALKQANARAVYGLTLARAV